MSTIYSKRTDALKNILSEHEAFLITNEVNIGYFTGFYHSEGVLLVTGGSVILYVDFRYIEAARKNSSDCDVVCFKKLSDSLIDELLKQEVTNVAFEASYLTVKQAEDFKEKLGKRGIEFIGGDRLDNKIGELRIIKDESEAAKLQTAQNIAEKAYLETLNYIKPGVTEKEISARMEYLMKLYGAEKISFDLITVTGKKTSLPHGVPSDNVVRQGDFFTCDFGAIYEGYHSDTTRTVAVGSVNDEMKQIYDTVLKAQLAALEVIRPGVKCCVVDKTARDIIEGAGYGEYFGHSTGHGVGLDIHEAPAVSSRCDTVLQNGMVITDEPGIYLPGKFGVRIEDMLLVTEDGFKNFVNLSKELIILNGD